MNFDLENCQINVTTLSSSGQIFQNSGDLGKERVGDGDAGKPRS